jgi:hypothetical protein
MTIIHHLTVVQQQIDIVTVMEKKIAIETIVMVEETVKTAVMEEEEMIVVSCKVSLFLQVINY